MCLATSRARDIIYGELHIGSGWAPYRVTSPAKVIMVMKVVIVGAGVIGLSCAYYLKEKFGNALSVTVIAEKFSPSTTSDKAGGFILPVDFGPSPHDANYNARVKQWAVDTFKHLYSLYKSETAADIGLCLVSGYQYWNKSVGLPWWKNMVVGFYCLSTSSPEVQMLRLPQNAQYMWSYSTFLVDCRQYLPWLMQEFVKKGGLVEKRRVLTLDELRHYDIVINCSGLGAVDLVGEPDMVPVRGQAVLVRAPWIKHFVIVNDDDKDMEEMTYILPRPDGVLLGGTSQRGNWSERVDANTSEAIVSRCAAQLPGLRRAEVIEAWAGGRPVRTTVRLEKEGQPQERPVIIHNYGHGGQGITLHWGCALEVGRIVENCITSIPDARL